MKKKAMKKKTVDRMTFVKQVRDEAGKFAEEFTMICEALGSLSEGPLDQVLIEFNGIYQGVQEVHDRMYRFREEANGYLFNVER